MNSKLLTPRRILIAIAIIAAILLFRECLKTRRNDAAAPDQVNIRYDAAATNLNPYLTAQGADIYTCARIFQTLGDMEPKTLELIPMMVDKIPQARKVTEGPHAGELAYDFEFLPEATWDNGTPITGNDMAFTLKLIFHPLLPTKAYSGYFKDFSGLDIEPSNPQKFTIYFKQYYILALESMCQIAVMPAYNYDPSNHLGNKPIGDFLDSIKLKAFETDPSLLAFEQEFKQAKFANDPNAIVGSGPYRMETMNEQGVILAKKQNWWGDKVSNKRPQLAAYPKKLVYKVVKDENVIENMLKNGELDIVASSLSPGKYTEMKQKDSLASRYNFDLTPGSLYSRWLLNLTKPHLQDVRVRKALAHIVDYDHFIKNIRLNMAVRTVGPILPTKRYFAKDIVPYDFNLQKAKDLLAEAGWSDSNADGVLDKTVNGTNEKFILEVLVSPIRISQQYAESLTETARLVGIEIKTVLVELPEIGLKSKNGDYESALLSAALYPGLSDLSQRYHSKYLSPAGDNRSRYANPKFDIILESIAKESDEAKRDALYLEAQKILHEDLPEIFILSAAQPMVTAKKFNAVLTNNRPGYYEQMFKLKK